MACYAAQLRQAQTAGECITVTVRQVLDAIGLVQPAVLTPDRRVPIERLCIAALVVLGFEPGTRGKHATTRQPNKVLRLPADAPMHAACASPSSADPALEPPASIELAKLNHIGPNGTAHTQRRLAAEKRGRSGHSVT